MKKLMLSLLSAAVVTAGAAHTAVAQDDGPQPLLVAWAKSYNELISDIDFIGEASDNPDLGQGLEGLLELVTQGQGLPIDKEKAWGLTVATNGFDFQILGFLPITDLEEFTQILGAVGQGLEDEGDGVYRIDVQAFSLYLKEVGDWTFVSMTPDGFDDVPEDPVELLGGLQNDYDMGVKAYIQNIPEVFRQLALEQIKVGMDENMPRLPDEGDAQFEMRTELMRSQLDSLTTLMEELDEVTFGVTIDTEKELGIIDLIITAVEGSAAAEQMAQASEGKTRFGGFLPEDGTMVGNINAVLSQDDIDQFLGMVEQIRSEIMDQIDGLDVIPDEAIRDQVKELVGEFVDIAQATVESGRLDASVAMTGEGPFQLMLGMQVAEGDELAKLFEKLVEMAETEAGFYGVQLDVDKHEGVRFHTLNVPYIGGEEGEMLETLFGSDLEVTLGLSEDAAYVCIGADGVETLKAAIDKSVEVADKELPPAHMRMHIGPFLELLSEIDTEDPVLSSMTLEVPEEDDQVEVIVTNIERGTKIHVEAEKGVLGALGTMIMTAAPQMMPGLGQ